MYSRMFSTVFQYAKLMLRSQADGFMSSSLDQYLTLGDWNILPHLTLELILPTFKYWKGYILILHTRFDEILIYAKIQTVLSPIILEIL